MILKAGASHWNEVSQALLIFAACSTASSLRRAAATLFRAGRRIVSLLLPFEYWRISRSSCSGSGWLIAFSQRARHYSPLFKTILAHETLIECQAFIPGFQPVQQGEPLHPPVDSLPGSQLNERSLETLILRGIVALRAGHYLGSALRGLRGRLH